MALNASGPISLAGSTTGQSIAVELGLGATTEISLNQAAVRTLAGIASGAIIIPTDFWGKSNAPSHQAIFAFGYSTVYTSAKNLISTTGVVAADTSTVASARTYAGAAGYGTDKAIFGFGMNSAGTRIATSNLVTNLGVVGSDVAGVGTIRYYAAGARYGTDKAIFAYGNKSNTASISRSSQTNLVSNTGVVAADQAALTGGPRSLLCAAGYGTDKAIIGFGNGTTLNTNTNLVSNTGVVAADVANSATIKYTAAAATYGTDKAIMGFGYNNPGVGVSLTNLVSNTGVVAADQAASLGSGRSQLGGAGYGIDTAIFAFGVAYPSGTPLNVSNLISNTGVVAANQAALTGTGRTTTGASFA